MRQLEERLGVRLLHRTTRSVLVTPPQIRFGRLVFDRVPMLCEKAIFDPECRPRSSFSGARVRKSVYGRSHNCPRDNQIVFVFERRRERLD
jgi:hypothetical protein